MSSFASGTVVLGVFLVAYFIGMYVTHLCTERGDQIVSGVVDGIPMSDRARWMALYCQWLPYAAFLAGFLIVVAAGLFSLANMTTSPAVALLARLSGGLIGLGGLFWLLLGSFYLSHIVSALRGR